jgi:hypothetical protein
VISYVALAALLIVPNDFEYPAVLVSLFVYPFMQWVCTECRVDLARPVTPLNWALLLFFMQVVVMTVLITFVGPTQGMLPFIPNGLAINTAILLVNLSYIAFCVGYQFGAIRLKKRRALAEAEAGGQADAAVRQAAPVDPSRWPLYWLANFAAGSVGLFCTFHSVGGLLQYFADPTEFRLAAAETTMTLAGAAGTFLKPYLGFTFIMVWCNWADRYGRLGSSLRRMAITAALILPALVGFATFNYNRGAFIAPLVSITAVYLVKVQRVSLVALAGFGSAALGVIILIGLYRASGLGMNALASDSLARQELAQKLHLVEELQVYGQAPQFLGFILEKTYYSRTLYLGYSLFCSIMQPVPTLGEPFRAASGPTLYNEMIYGKNGFNDQIIPLQGELYLNFHIPGIAAGFWLLGLVASGLQHAFKKATTALDIYSTLYVSYWVLFLIQANLAIISQIVIFFLWPVYSYVGLRFVLTRLLARA